MQLQFTNIKHFSHSNDNFCEFHSLYIFKMRRLLFNFNINILILIFCAKAKNIIALLNKNSRTI